MANENRIPLSDLLNSTGPIKASDWFAHFDKLPKDVLDKPVEPVKKTKKRKTTTKKEVTRDAETVTSVTAPKELDVDVSVSVTPINTTPKISTKQELVDDIKKSTESQKEFSTLIDSIVGLTKIIQENAIKEIQAEELPRHKEGASNLKELFKNIVTSKVESFKEKTSLRNMMIMSGIGSAHKGSESIVDNILGFLENKKEQKKILKKEGKEEAPGWGSAIVGGTKDYLGNKLRNAIDNSSDAIKKVYNTTGSTIVGKKIHGFAGDIIQKTSDVTNGVKTGFAQKVFDLNKKAKITAISNPNSLFGTIARRKFPEISKNPGLEAARMIHHPANKTEREFSQGVRDGIEEELLKINKEQLSQLKKLVDTSVQSKSEKLEETLEAKDEAPKDMTFSQDKKKEEKSNSLLDKLFSSFTGKIGNIFSKITKTLGPLLRFAMPAAGVLGAGAVGYGVGTLINNNLINPLAEKITGTKGASLGTAIYDGVDKVKGWFGASDADKMRESEEAYKNRVKTDSTPSVSVDNKNNQTSLKTDSTVSAIDSNDGKKLLDSSEAEKNQKNIITPTASIEKPSNPLLSMINKQGSKSATPNKAVRNLSMNLESTPIKQANVYRLNQMEQVKATIKETEKLKDSKEKNQTNSMVDARTNITNNSNTIHHIRPNVCNPDRTFNRLLYASFNIE